MAGYHCQVGWDSRRGEDVGLASGPGLRDHPERDGHSGRQTTVRSRGVAGGCSLLAGASQLAGHNTEESGCPPFGDVSDVGLGTGGSHPGVWQWTD